MGMLLCIRMLIGWVMCGVCSVVVVVVRVMHRWLLGLTELLVEYKYWDD